MENMNETKTHWRKSGENFSSNQFKTKTKYAVQTSSMLRIYKFMMREMNSGARNISVNIDGLCFAMSGINDVHITPVVDIDPTLSNSSIDKCDDNV